MSDVHAHAIEVAGADFAFREVHVPDRAVMAPTVAEAAGAHPADDYVVLRRLETLELEPLNNKEPVLIRENPREQFFVIKGSVLYRFDAQGLSFEWPQRVIVGLTIKRLLDQDRDDIEVVLRDRQGEKVIGDHEEVDLAEDGLEHFHLREVHHPITIYVDGEPYDPPSREMTPNQIIDKAAEKDPATNYLVQIRPHGAPISYKDQGEIPIRLHNDERFQVISTGPTPVSDPQLRTGVAAFIDGLRTLGFSPTQVPNQPDCVVIDYTVPTGKFAGKLVRHGFIVPQDFPITPPSGPHVSPDIHPINAVQGPHPAAGIHRTQAQPFQGLGGDWQYWSRPHPNWAKSKRNVAAYMAHVWNLWDTQ